MIVKLVITKFFFGISFFLTILRIVQLNNLQLGIELSGNEARKGWQSLYSNFTTLIITQHNFNSFKII